LLRYSQQQVEEKKKEGEEDNEIHVDDDSLFEVASPSSVDGITTEKQIKLGDEFKKKKK
jgi:hypothetical protein